MKPMHQVAACIAGLLILGGCSKLTRENFDKIDIGMDYAQVVAVIGEPDRCDGALGAKSCIWGDDTRNIRIKFVGEKVILPSMTGL